MTPPAAAGQVVSGLALSPHALPARPQGHTSITFSARQAADVTVLVLKYQVLVVASNAHGSQTAQSPLQIGSP